MAKSIARGAERTWATLGHRKAPRGDIRSASVLASVSGKFALLEDDHRVEAPALGSPLGAFLCPSVANAPCDALRRGLQLDDTWS
ncbi:hypothetical protein EMCRGX_G024901 [Ephydatia muelleri]